MNGVVEIAWFFPTKKDTERRFEECITFTNLHGDANDHNEQFKILANNATVNVVLMESEESANGSSNLKFLKETGKPLIIIGKFQGANKKTNIKLRVSDNVNTENRANDRRKKINPGGKKLFFATAR